MCIIKSNILRSGGASQAANNNVIDRLFKAHGRWRSENAKDGYVKDSLLSWVKLPVRAY
jgi:pyocin large subunit-like protein